MNRGVKMAVLARQAGEKRRMDELRDNYPYYNQDDTRADYGRIYHDMTYGDTEARFRDRQGREHYDNGRFAPRGDMDEPEDDYGPESRRYRRDDAGRFRSEYPYTPLVPPVYREGGMEMNRIGFAAEPRRELEQEYRTDANYPRMDEMGHRTSDTMMGHARGGGMKLTKEMAEEWMKGLQNEDGTKGAHWTIERAKQVMAQRGIQSDLYEFWAVLCMMYSDYCSVLKKHNANQMDVYVDLACAWINDKDAGEGKTARYFEQVVMK